MLHSGDLDFSFSGIKTAVRYLIESLPKPLDIETKRAIAHEFQTAVTDVLAAKTARAVDDYHLSALIVAGGVSANTHIRARLSDLALSLDIPLFLPTGILAMDNALMIAIAGSLKLHDSSYIPPPLDTIRADGNWSL
jgi:N6-L-threonylcarbamoyladenine synthase